MQFTEVFEFDISQLGDGTVDDRSSTANFQTGFKSSVAGYETDCPILENWASRRRLSRSRECNIPAIPMLKDFSDGSGSVVAEVHGHRQWPRCLLASRERILDAGL